MTPAKIFLKQLRKTLPVLFKSPEKLKQMQADFDILTEDIKETESVVSHKTAGEILKRLKEGNIQPISYSEIIKSEATNPRVPPLKKGRIEFSDFFSYIKGFKKDARPEVLIKMFNGQFAGLTISRSPLTLCPGVLQRTEEILDYLEKEQK